VEFEHADKAVKRTAMRVNRERFNASTFHERSAIGGWELRRMRTAHLLVGKRQKGSRSSSSRRLILCSPF
jgi:hypothetical protein